MTSNNDIQTSAPDPQPTEVEINPLQEQVDTNALKEQAVRIVCEAIDEATLKSFTCSEPVTKEQVQKAMVSYLELLKEGGSLADYSLQQIEPYIIDSHIIEKQGLASVLKQYETRTVVVPVRRTGPHYPRRLLRKRLQELHGHFMDVPLTLVPHEPINRIKVSYVLLKGNTDEASDKG